jgi:tetratricopeptide (TPR) repeat protein
MALTAAMTVLAVGGLFSALSAQVGGPGGTPPGGEVNPNSGTNRGSVPAPGSVATPTTTETAQPIMISGRVMLEDGTPPTESVALETLCATARRTEGHTGPDGYFSLQLGARNGVIQDASEDRSTPWFQNRPSFAPTSMGRSAGATNRYASCEFLARLPGYRSQSITLSGRRFLDNPDIGVILLHRIHPGEGSPTVSAISLAAPKDARRSYEKALDAFKHAKWDEEQRNLERAVEIYPRYADAWFELGMLQARQGKPDMARAYFRQAIQADPKYVQPYLQMALLELSTAHWKQLLEVGTKLVTLDPFGYPQVYFFNALAAYTLNDFETAEKNARTAEKLDTPHAIPQASYLLGMILARRKDYAGAADRLKAYLAYAGDAKDATKVRAQIAEFERVLAAKAEVAP